MPNAADDHPAPPISLTLRANGLRHRVAICGPRRGPLVCLMHGWPESWYSWRHQLARSAAPATVQSRPTCAAMAARTRRNPSKHTQFSTLPPTCSACSTHSDATPVRSSVTTGARVPLADRHAPPEPLCRARRLQRAVCRPRRVAAERKVYDAMTDGGAPLHFVPQRGRRRRGGRVRRSAAHLLRRLFAGPAAARGAGDHRPAARGGRLHRADGRAGVAARVDLEADVDYFAAAFERSGFRGGLNYYRNLDRNWASTASLSGATIAQPALFVAGAADKTLNLYGGAERAVKAFLRKAPRGEATIRTQRRPLDQRRGRRSAATPSSAASRHCARALTRARRCESAARVDCRYGFRKSVEVAPVLPRRLRSPRPRPRAPRRAPRRARARPRPRRRRRARRPRRPPRRARGGAPPPLIDSDGARRSRELTISRAERSDSVERRSDWR